MPDGGKAEVNRDVILELAPGLNPNWGPTLADLRARLGGSDQGTFTDPRYGTKHVVDLRPWTHLPPQTRFILRFHYPVSESHRERRRLALEDLLTAGMPFVADEARTLDELLDMGLETQDLMPQPDGTFQELASAPRFVPPCGEWRGVPHRHRDTTRPLPLLARCSSRICCTRTARYQRGIAATLVP
jgi:hypothetical protein